MLPFAQDLGELFTSRNDALVEHARQVNLTTPGMRRYEPSDIQQMVNGFTSVFLEGAEQRGRDTFLFFTETLPPNLIANGDTWETNLQASVAFGGRIILEVALHMRPEYRAEACSWISNYLAEYAVAATRGGVFATSKRSG